jgi:hypothetical protein
LGIRGYKYSRCIKEGLVLTKHTNRQILSNAQKSSKLRFMLTVFWTGISNIEGKKALNGGKIWGIFS